MAVKSCLGICLLIFFQVANNGNSGEFSIFFVYAEFLEPYTLLEDSFFFIG